MERVDGIEMSVEAVAEYFGNLCIVVVAELFQARGVIDEIRPLEAAPCASVHDVGSLPFGHFCSIGIFQEILRNHPDIPGYDGLHAVFFHPCENLLGERFALCVPTFGLRASPSRHVVHEKPPVVGRAGDKLVDLVERRIAVVFGQYAFPDAFHARDDERHIDAVESHPVDFLLPAFPVPEGHRIAVGAEVQIVAVIDAARVLFAGDDGQFSGQFSRRVVPRNIDSRMVLQKPVDARGDGDVVAAIDMCAVAVAGDAEVWRIGGKIGDAVFDAIGIFGQDALQQSVDGLCRGRRAHGAKKGNDEKFEIFHVCYGFR